MYIVLGATGHVGAAVAEALLAERRPVTVVTRDASRAAPLRARGALVREVDIHDSDRLRTVLRQGKRAFLLNPPADPSGDSDRQERRTVASILQALEGSGLERAVAQSTYGARPGEACGDLTVLHELEQGLRAQPFPVAIQRGAYYMSNYDGLFQHVREHGTLPSMFAAQFELPMVAPQDLGRIAAQQLVADAASPALYHVEGPRRYTPSDVAAAFGKLLGRTVQLEVTPRERWIESFEAMGFSAASARSYARMTAATVDGAHEFPSDPLRGHTTLDAYLGSLR
jgi:uncharacterized protein YbjT (DUF2867 family)